MKIYSLTGPVPIVKEYKLKPDGTVEKTPYPFVQEFTSSEHSVTDIQSLYNTVNTVSSNNGTLAKGILTRDLVKERRAGATISDTPTEWICLDLDGVQGFQTVDQFLDEIGLGNTDYVLQWSSSMGIENNTGFRCHIFMLLDKPMNPHMLKLWLQHLNLSTPSLQPSLRLTKTYSALVWPLDITTCQNDKLIYVAEPKIDPSIVNPFANGKRISVAIKGKRTASIPSNIPSTATIKTKIDAKINEFREIGGFPKRKESKYKFAGDIEYLQNPDTAIVTDIKVERGFVYLNLNGGDSWGYYHPEDNPAFIFNFKGEPTYRTEDLLPQYWAKIVQRVKSYKPDTTGTVYLAFRDLHTAVYWNGTYNSATDTLAIYKASGKEQLHDFMKQHGQPLGDYIPDWILEWEPQNTIKLDPIKKTINTYRPSRFFTMATKQVSGPPKTINKLVSHVLGGDPAAIEHFYNWLAVIAQKHDRTGTSWVFQSLQGSGKGILFHKVLTPIFGEDNVVSKRVDEIESQFTGFFRNKFIVYIDEMEIGKGDYFSKVTAKLKNIIVEPRVSIRSMYNEPIEVKNYSNLIFATNKIQGAQIDMDDRRYNVGVYQRIPATSVLTDQEIDVDIPSEVEAFAHYLRTRNADVAKARKPLDNAARRILQRIGQTGIDEISMNLKAGNLQYFTEWIQDPAEVGLKKYAAQQYRDLIVDCAQSPGPRILTRSDVQIILNWLLDGVPQTPVKFASYVKHHDLEIAPVWNGSRTVRGMSVNWQADPAWLQQFLADVASGAI